MPALCQENERVSGSLNSAIFSHLATPTSSQDTRAKAWLGRAKGLPATPPATAVGTKYLVDKSYWDARFFSSSRIFRILPAFMA